MVQRHRQRGHRRNDSFPDRLDSPQHGPLLHRRGFRGNRPHRHLLAQHHHEGPGLTETRDQAIPDKRGHGTPSGPYSPRTQSSMLYNHNVALRGQDPMYPPEYQHILDFLDSNPEYLQDMRTRLLIPDLIALPEAIRPARRPSDRPQHQFSRLLPKPLTAVSRPLKPTWPPCRAAISKTAPG